MNRFFFFFGWQYHELNPDFDISWQAFRSTTNQITEKK